MVAPAAPTAQPAGKTSDERTAGRRPASVLQNSRRPPRDTCRAPRREFAPTATSSYRRRATGTAACATMGPASSSGVTKCTVAPLTFTPCSSACRCASTPGKDGKQRGVDIQDGIGKRVAEAGPSRRMNPARHTRLDLRRSSASHQRPVVRGARRIGRDAASPASRCPRPRRAPGPRRRACSKSRGAMRRTESPGSNGVDQRLQVRSPP